jgi:hypothetical protein
VLRRLLFLDDLPPIILRPLPRLLLRLLAFFPLEPFPFEDFGGDFGGDFRGDFGGDGVGEFA